MLRLLTMSTIIITFFMMFVIPRRHSSTNKIQAQKASFLIKSLVLGIAINIIASSLRNLAILPLSQTETRSVNNVP
jgi:hypothetical protein